MSAAGAASLLPQNIANLSTFMVAWLNLEAHKAGLGLIIERACESPVLRRCAPSFSMIDWMLRYDDRTYAL